MGEDQHVLCEAIEAALVATGAAVLVIGPDGSALGHSSFARAFGLSEETIPGASRDAVIDALQRLGAEPVATVLSEHAPGGLGELMLSDGRVFTWQAIAIRGGSVCVWVFRDVTSSRQLVLALHDAGNWLRMLETHMTDAVVVELDEDARFVATWANSAAFFTKPDEMLEGRGLVEAIGEPHGSVLDARVQKVLATGKADSYEYVLERDGQRRVFVASMVLMESTNSEPPHVTMMVRDVTELARIQARLLETEKLASMGLLAAGVAHEINNPLAYTLLNLERLRTGLQGIARRAPEVETLAGVIGPFLDSVEMCLEGCRRVQSIVQDLRHFSRSDQDNSRVPVDVCRVLEFAIDMVSAEVRRRARVVRDFGETPFVLASEGRLTQVFLNLIMNAMQAIPEGAPDENAIHVATSTDERGRAVIEIRDSGEGMTPEVMAHIFEPFYTTKPPGLGTGLGLAICHGIATSIGGEIAVESVRGRGSTFRVMLPAATQQKPRKSE